MSATLDVKAMLWRTSPAATELEQVTMKWLGALIGMPADWTGIIYDTASIAGFTAIATAREALDLGIRERGMSGRDLPRLRVYITEHTHSHVEKAAIALGIGQENVVRVPCDAAFRMLPERLDACIAQDLAAGHKPLCIVATVGTTSITSVDPVAEIATVARKHGVWLHVDAAYAGMAAMVPEYAHLLDGVAQADSLVVNPHKWMFVPMDLSVLFVKDEAMIRRAFSLVPEYLTTTDGDVVNYMDYGLQLGRRFRSLKLWFVLRHLGANGIRARLRAHIELAQIFAAWVEDEPDWEVHGAASALGRVFPVRAERSRRRYLRRPERRAARRCQCNRKTVYLAHEDRRDVRTALSDRQRAHAALRRGTRVERPSGTGGGALKGGLYALAGIVAAILLVGIVASKITVDNQEQMLGVFETRIALQRAFVDVIDQETAIRGYAATHDRRMLEPYFAARSDIAANFADLEAEGGQSLHPEVSEMERLYSFWRRAVGDPLIERAGPARSRGPRNPRKVYRRSNPRRRARWRG